MCMCVLYCVGGYVMGGHGGMPPHPSGVAPPHQQSPRQQPQPIPGTCTHNNIFCTLTLCVCVCVYSVLPRVFRGILGRVCFGRSQEPHQSV